MLRARALKLGIPSLFEGLLVTILGRRIEYISDVIEALYQKQGVIAGEPEGSWRAGGQQEGLQYNGEAA